jgi:nucleoside-diphosphate-sugar epimerase
MSEQPRDGFIIGPEDLILITGTTGFIGSKLVETLLTRGFRRLRCLARPSSEQGALAALGERLTGAGQLEIVHGNLLSPTDCAAATDGATVVFHLATSREAKSYPDTFLNTVVTTRNLLEASRKHGCVRRFVNVSSFAVYANTPTRDGRLLDETCPIEAHPALRGDAYCFAKVRQDELVTEYGKRFGLPYVTVRPGYVLGPDKEGISSRVGIDTFGVFLHLGGRNTMPFTYVDNCADAIALAGLTRGIEGETFNVVDDDLPSSRQFLRLYKKNVRRFTSLYVPHAVSYVLCYLWERYSTWSEGQLLPTFNRRHWHAYWKNTRYSNEKLKTRLGWTPRVPMAEGLRRCFTSYRARVEHA